MGGRVWLALSVVCISQVFCSGLWTPLDEYVNRADPNYRYEELSATREPGYCVYTLNMTSQKWKSEMTVSQPVWWHYLTVIIPDKLKYSDTAHLLIDGGSNTSPPPDITDKFVFYMAMIAINTGMIGANLKMIPNQPLVFKEDPQQKSRKEDSIVAWTWKKYLENTSDPEILLRMPMTKAAVRALDTITSIVQKKKSLKVNRFLVAGASKRGWTTWTTAAVDKRVIGIAPIVMDLLNLGKNLHHHYRAYGGWSFVLGDYYVENITSKLDFPNFDKMAYIIDPIAYNDRLTMPKYIISATGDEFFLPDDSHYYYKKLLGPKYLRVVPNAEHSMFGHIADVFRSIQGFYVSVASGTPLPHVTWTMNETATGGSIIVQTDQTPVSVITYFAKTFDGERRDFRLLVGSSDNPPKPIIHPVFWFPKSPASLGNNRYIASFDKPRTGWLGFLIQMRFNGVDGNLLDFTTEVNIIPSSFPFPDCHGNECHGSLL